LARSWDTLGESLLAVEILNQIGRFVMYRRMVLLAATALITLAGCTTTAQLRETVKKGVDPLQCKDASTENCGRTSFLNFPKEDFHLGFLEIDDQGEMLDEGQMSRILEHLKTKSNHHVLVYVHGWFHNSSADDEDVNEFVERLKRTKRKLNEETKLTGIYVGWRGSSVNFPLLKFLTFWDRKNTSEEIGRNSLTEFLVRVEKTVKKNDQGKQNRLILTAHSFGASVLYNSLSQIFIERLLNSEPCSVQGFGDLVVLINPAFEAMRLLPVQAAIERLSRTREVDAPLHDPKTIPRNESCNSYGVKHYFPDDRPPILVIAGSSGDWANQFTFPIGRVFSTAFERHRDVEQIRRTGKPRTFYQAKMDRKSAANYEDFITHELEFDSKAKSSNSKSCKADPKWIETAISSSRTALQNRDGEQWVAREKSSGAKDAFIDTAYRLKLKHIGTSEAANPLWVVRVSPEVVKNHSDISTDAFWCFVDLLTPSLVDGAEHQETSKTIKFGDGKID
jgi:Alpha/beta hydrolase of unknown function (DUF900)